MICRIYISIWYGWKLILQDKLFQQIQILQIYPKLWQLTCLIKWSLLYIYILYIYIFCGNSPDWILATLDSWSGQGYPHEKDGTVYSGKVFANVPLCTTVSVGANTYIHYVDVVVFNILGGLADCNLTATNLAQMLRPAGFSRTSEALWLSAVTSEVDL